MLLLGVKPLLVSLLGLVLFVLSSVFGSSAGPIDNFPLIGSFCQGHWMTPLYTHTSPLEDMNNHKIVIFPLLPSDLWRLDKKYIYFIFLFVSFVCFCPHQFLSFLSLLFLSPIIQFYSTHTNTNTWCYLSLLLIDFFLLSHVHCFVLQKSCLWM